MGFYSKISRFFLILTTAFTLGVQYPVYSLASIPVTGLAHLEEKRPADFANLSLDDFIAVVKNGDKSRITGLYSEKVFSLQVMQQPAGKPGFVSPVEGFATQFGMASKNNITGMLAHNFSSGRLFFNLATGDQIDVIYGDGSIKKYSVDSIKRFQALSPKSSSSEFVDLESGEKLSSISLFNRMYGGEHHLTLQTCIQQGNEDSWGRIFIIAQPIIE